MLLAGMAMRIFCAAAVPLQTKPTKKSTVDNIPMLTLILLVGKFELLAIFIGSPSEHCARCFVVDHTGLSVEPLNGVSKGGVHPLWSRSGQNPDREVAAFNKNQAESMETQKICQLELFREEKERFRECVDKPELYSLNT